jgi:formylglycine-generating enzyme required for sulfatase activity
VQESSNLILFLEWGYEHELSSDQICRSARITALLSDYWRWIEANQDPLVRLDLALAAAQRNQDQEGELLVANAIIAVSEIFFDFKTVTVNPRGEIIQRETKLAQYYTENLGNNVTLEMVLIPKGIFMMGSPEDEVLSFKSQSPQHQVTVPTFFIGKYPVTQAQWRAVVFMPQINQQLQLDPSRFKGENLPVESVSWYDAVEFCLRLSQHTGKSYRLPSEAEWEYACRAGTTTPFHFGKTITTDLANYRGTDNGKWLGSYGQGPKGIYRQETTEVGSFEVANQFGLYDMHGNVWEWCQDHWHNNYESAPIDGSAWEDYYSNNRRMLRGNSWFNCPEYARSAFRATFDAYSKSSNFGFRIVCDAM